MDKDFSIIKSSRKRIKKRTLLFLGIPILIIFQYIFHSLDLSLIGWLITIMLVILLIFNFIIIRIYPKYEVVGVLRFSDSAIFLLDKKYNIEIIDSISVLYRNYKGGSSKVTLMSYYEGDENWIELKFKSGEIIEYNFLSTSKNDYRIINQYLKRYAAMGIHTELKEHPTTPSSGSPTP